jgi:hypothetical protein
MNVLIRNSTRISCFGLFSVGFSVFLYKSSKSKYECVRMGAAGSIATASVELGFYFLDTLNSRSKVKKES